jgi:hypothetical protein
VTDSTNHQDPKAQLIAKSPKQANVATPFVSKSETVPYDHPGHIQSGRQHIHHESFCGLPCE